MGGRLNFGTITSNWLGSLISDSMNLSKLSFVKCSNCCRLDRVVSYVLRLLVSLGLAPFTGVFVLVSSVWARLLGQLRSR